MMVEGRCYECFRPLVACFCEFIPRIENTTEIVILQHPRERFHPFNTARIVHKALGNCQLLVDAIPNLKMRLKLSPRAGLLYPGPAAQRIEALPREDRPDQLVVIDGTWHHAKTLVRDIPTLQALPRYCLAPSTPSRYRIRREPDAMSLSTIEAVVAALRSLEPENLAVEQLLTAFDAMVEGQLAHPGSAAGARFRARRNRTVKNIPLALKGDLRNVVVAYGEAAPGERGSKRTAMPPISWVAQRLGDGVMFAHTLNPPCPLSDIFLRHTELSAAQFEHALSLPEARQRWEEFRRPGDFVTVVHPGTARLLSYLAAEGTGCFQLKSIDVKSILAETLLEEPPSASEQPSADSQNLGRSTKRLAIAIALVRRLNALVRNEELAFYAGAAKNCT